MKQDFIEMYEKGKEFAGDHRGLYSSQESANRRFKATAELLRGKVESDAPITVLDIGCGYGDLSLTLKEIVGDVTYTGLEAVKWIADSAKEKCPDITVLNMTLEEAYENRESLALKFDYVVALGVLATVPKDELGEFARKMCSMAKKGVIVSYLREGEYKTDEGFSSWTADEVAEAFLYPVYASNAVSPEQGITTIVYFPVGK